MDRFRDARSPIETSKKPFEFSCRLGNERHRFVSNALLKRCHVDTRLGAGDGGINRHADSPRPGFHLSMGPCVPVAPRDAGRLGVVRAWWSARCNGDPRRSLIHRMSAALLECQVKRRGIRLDHQEGHSRVTVSNKKACARLQRIGQSLENRSSRITECWLELAGQRNDATADPESAIGALAYQVAIAQRGERPHGHGAMDADMISGLLHGYPVTRLGDELEDFEAAHQCLRTRRVWRGGSTGR